MCFRVLGFQGLGFRILCPADKIIMPVASSGHAMTQAIPSLNLLGEALLNLRALGLEGSREPRFNRGLKLIGV